MSAELTLAAAFVLGLLGSTHCLAMCGGISASLGTGGHDQGRLLRVALYNIGRIGSYTAAGAIVGLLGFWIGQGLNLMGLGIGLRIALGVLMVGIGLQLVFNWDGLKRIEAAGAGFWRLLAPLARRLLPARTPMQALALGALWGWLPCGLVYTVLVAATVSATPVHGALVMLAFGLGTAPSMVLVGAAGSRLTRLMQRRGLRRLAGGAILGFGLWTLATPMLHLGHATGGHAPMHAPATDASAPDSRQQHGTHHH